jgi:tRNA A-37 threonylcarbamoyl transferase component Bud32/tetratricopeptide (TPR) repeat protein
MSRPDRTEAVGTGEPAEAEIRLLAPGTSLGERYEIRRVLGTGGYAAVYLTWDRELRREVALKVLRADRMSQNALRRLQREAAVARDLHSPRLLRVYDIGQADGAVYLTLEYVDGGSLRERLKQGALPVDEAVRIATQILEGLDALHTAGVVHRDVKPGNILLTAQGDVKLGDFGLALQWDRQDTRLTVSETVVGTVDYIAPEQALGGEASPRSDLYGLGVVLFEMLTGRIPYESDSRLGAMLKHVKQDAPDARSFRKEIPAWLAAVVAGLLARDPARRYGSAQAVLDELEGRSLFANPHWRRKVVLRGLAAAGIVAAVATGAAWWWASQPRFAQLSSPNGNTLVARSGDGTALWQLDDIDPMEGFVVVRLRPGGPRRVVGVRRVRGDISGEHARRLSILDPENGRVLETVNMPDTEGHFPGYADTWGLQLRAADLDGEGGDEIVVSYAHTPYWPSYTVLYEPRIQRARTVFWATGHHRFGGAADLDGDGRMELLLVGTNNRMGYHSAMAALSVNPPVNEGSLTGRYPAAASPGSVLNNTPRAGLLWYALTARGQIDRGREARVDAEHRLLEMPFMDGSASLGFDGFAPGTTGPPERQDLRFRAYERLSESQRFLALGQPQRAAELCSEAAELAARAGDAIRASWARIGRAGALIASGEHAAAEAIYRETMPVDDDPGEIALTAARVFHLRGDLPRALRWYRQGLATGVSNARGRGRYESLEGIALASVEMGAPLGVLPDLRTFRQAFPEEESATYAVESFALWRGGRQPPEFSVHGAATDLARYWALEVRRTHHEAPSALLPLVEAEVSRHNTVEPLFASLRGELLDDLGRREEARASAAAAWEAGLAAAPAEISIRAHLDLVGRRYARLARLQGLVGEARKVERALADWKAATRAASRVEATAKLTS